MRLTFEQHKKPTNLCLEAAELLVELVHFADGDWARDSRVIVGLALEASLLNLFFFVERGSGGPKEKRRVKKKPEATDNAAFAPSRHSGGPP